jgi:acetolactate synthase I/II/III large subunit
VGDVDLFLQAAIHEVNGKRGGKADQTPVEKTPRIAALIQERQAERDAFFAASAHANVPGKPQLFVKEIIDLLKRDAIVALGAGLYARYAGRLPIRTPRSYLKSLGLGALGWAFPAALGAKLGRPSSQVVALMGDADFLTVMQDLHTAVRENIAVAVVIFNDCGHGSIRELQKREYEGRVIGSDYPPPSFHEYARIAGAQGVRITKPEEVKPALGRLLDSGKPGILEVFIPPYPA